jgi:3D-(3,5/4)-trihydroxycyclohexane-1,2-dione acylhydrolase (decyclizing)
MGVRLAEPDPDRPVVVLIGDGSYLMMNSEIVTAAAEGLDLTIVVIDNDGYQSIHGLQRSVGSPQFGTELRRRDAASGRLVGEPVRVDYAAHAASMGAHAVYAQTAAQAREALEAAHRARGLQVVVIRTDPEKRLDLGDTGSWWDVPPAQVSGQSPVRAARASYEQALQQRVSYAAPTDHENRGGPQ